MRKFTAAASRRHPNNFDGIWLEEVDPPPGTGLALGFRASFPVVLRAKVTIITVIRVSAPHSRRLVCRFAETHVRTCCAIFVPLQFRHHGISRVKPQFVVNFYLISTRVAFAIVIQHRKRRLFNTY